MTLHQLSDALLIADYASCGGFLCAERMYFSVGSRSSARLRKAKNSTSRARGLGIRGSFSDSSDSHFKRKSQSISRGGIKSSSYSLTGTNISKNCSCSKYEGQVGG